MSRLAGIIATAALAGAIAACGSGGGGSAPAEKYRFSYVVNTGDNTVSVYSVSTASGEMRHQGYAVTGTSPRAAAVDRAGAFLYVANSGSNNISAFTIDAASGQLTAVAGSPFAAGTAPYAVAVDPSGKFLYAANSTSNNISAFTIDAASGALTVLAGSPYAAGTAPYALAVDPTGKFLYAANNGTDNISAYLINGTTGALTDIDANSATSGTQHFAAGTKPYELTTDPAGKFLYAVNSGSNNITAYAINATSGVLTAIPNQPFLVGASTAPQSIAVDPAGKYVFTANSGGQTVAVLSIDAAGALDHVPTVFAGNAPKSVRVDPGGKYVYVANSDNEVYIYSLNATTGQLTKIGVIRARAGCAAMAMTETAITASYTPKFAYTANLNDSLSAYRINASTGALSLTGTIGTGALTGPRSLAVDPRGRFAYAAYFGNITNGQVGAFSVAADTGALTGIGSIAAGNSTWRVVVDPSGRFVYGLNNWSPGNVSAYSINTDGSLTAVGGSPFALDTYPMDIEIDPAGKFVYVANGSSVRVLSINATSGALTALQTYTPVVSADFRSLSVDPTGRFLYLGDYTYWTISAHKINPNGTLTALGAPISVGENVQDVSTDSRGKFVVALSGGGSAGTISTFGINADGTLSETTGFSYDRGTLPFSAAADISGRFFYVVNLNADSVSAFRLNGSTGALANVAGSPFAASAPYFVTTFGKLE